jgi:predicted porin
VKANFWLNGITENLQAANATDAASIGFTAGEAVRATGFDGGVKLTAGPASVVAYGYNGRGIGTEALLLLGVDPLGHPRETRGGYLQGTFTLAKKLTLGGSWGISHLSLTRNDTGASTALLKSNASEVAQVRYAMTKWVTPIAEYTHTTATSHNDLLAPKATEDSLAFGAIVFF